jgi:uncharacterized protein DUF1918
MMPGTPDRELLDQASLRASVGDTLVLGEDLRNARIGEIVAVPSGDGSPPYRVRWLAGEYESLIFPGPGAHIRKGR